MRRTLVLLAIVASLSSLVVRPSPAHAQIGGHTATCIFTTYTVTGSFTRVGGGTTFGIQASGGCAGTATTASLDLSYTSIGPWSCDAGVAQGGGAMTITWNGGTSTPIVDSSLVNVGGEYVFELHTASLTGAVAAGQFTTLPIPCDLGATQTTIGGTGTLTFTA